MEKISSAKRKMMVDNDKVKKQAKSNFWENPFAYVGISVFMSIFLLLCEIISRQDKCRANGFPEGYCSGNGVMFLLFRLVQFIAMPVALSFSIVAMAKVKNTNRRSLLICCAILSFLLAIAVSVFIFWEVFAFLK